LDLGKQMVRYGRGRVRLLRKHPESFSLPGFLPGIGLFCAVAGAGLASFSAVLTLAYAAGVLCYCLIVVSTALGIACRTREGRLFLWLPAVFVAIHGGAGLGILMEFIGGSKRMSGDVGTLARKCREAS
jgi:hypothetical protein